eukprot:s1015_g15.t1
MQVSTHIQARKGSSPMLHNCNTGHFDVTAMVLEVSRTVSSSTLPVHGRIHIARRKKLLILKCRCDSYLIYVGNIVNTVVTYAFTATLWGLLFSQLAL